MASPIEFNQESVRQFLLAQPDGRVTNHALVKHFKAWLTHPTEKTSARQRFKEYVNTLATIQQSESGEKFLVLKPKFFPKFDDDDDNVIERKQPSPSLLDEVMAGYRPLTSPASHTSGTSSKVSPSSDLGLPLGSASSIASSRRSSYSSLSAAGYAVHSNNPAYKLPTVRPLPPDPPDLGLPLNRPQRILPVVENNQSEATKPPLPPPHRPVSSQATNPHPRPPPPFSFETPPIPPALPPRNNNNNILTRNEESATIQPHVEDNMMKKNLDEDDQSSPQGLDTVSPDVVDSNEESNAESCRTSGDVSSKTSSPVDNSGSDGTSMVLPTSIEGGRGEEKMEPISVRERTKTFNRMSSESELNSERKVSSKSSMNNLSKVQGSRKQSSSSSVRRKNSTRGVVSSRDSNRMSAASDVDTASISTIDQTSKVWMVRSSQGDYHAMLKMLRDDPRLAKHRDFTSGFTALHWAAKHGDLDTVKLLAGQHCCDVNAKSHGGYTPLHLACQFGHQEVFDLLVKAYNADPQLRDNAGRTPRQYMMEGAALQHNGPGSAGVLTLSSDTFRQLKDRRRNRNRPLRRDHSTKSTNSGGILRFGSLSVRVKKTTEAFNNYFSNNAGSNAGNSGSKIDQILMPPPSSGPPVVAKFGGLKKSKSKRGAELMSGSSNRSRRASIKEEESDSEFGFDSQWSESK